MLLVTDIHDLLPLEQPSGLTIGSFDGVHLGHQALLAHLRSKIPPGALLAVFTFSNHPSHHFAPHAPTPLICPPLQKAKLLGEYGADVVILSPFTPEFAMTPFDQFLRLLKEKLGFEQLVLGTGATFGKGREGNEVGVRKMSQELGFEVEYMPKFTLQGAPVSSGRVRSLIAQGAFAEVKTLLGRPYSLLCELEKENNFYSFLVKGLCLPPEGTYPVLVRTTHKELPATAKVAPKDNKISLKFIDNYTSISKIESEVIFS